MGGFTLLEHPADVGVLATGHDLSSALSWAARGMFNVIADLDQVVPTQTIHVSVTSRDRESLVVDWLNELLYRHEAEGFLAKEFRVAADDAGTSLEADCAGEPIDPRRHRLLTSVKAATYHDVEVSGNGEWTIRVLLDV